jgi:hypothetical protein
MLHSTVLTRSYGNIPKPPPTRPSRSNYGSIWGHPTFQRGGAPLIPRALANQRSEGVRGVKGGIWSWIQHKMTLCRSLESACYSAPCIHIINWESPRPVPARLIPSNQTRPDQLHNYPPHPNHQLVIQNGDSQSRRQDRRYRHPVYDR